MITKSRFATMTATVFMVFVFSAMWTVPAFADDSTPPPPLDTPTEVAPPADQPVVVVAPSTEVIAPADVVPTEPAPTNVVSPADATITEVLAQAPEGTDVQVVDANGNALPLATQDAADAVVNGDPIWCPAGISPKANTGGCTNSYTSLAALITQLNTVTDPAKAGVIWIEGSYKSSNVLNDPGVTSFTIDGDDFSNMQNFALTIKGGWSGVALSTVTNPSTPSLFSGASLSIVDWHGDVTISDIVVDGATDNASNSGAGNSGLWVTTTGNILLDRVTVKNSKNSNAMIGATIDNSGSGAVAKTVIVNNGIFQKNEGDGLRVYSAGVITLNSIIADANDVGGAVIDNTSAITDRAVTLKGTQEYNNNGNGAGLKVLSDGAITISNVISDGNAGNGVDLNNTTSLTNQGVTVNGTNNFVDNAVGLNILTHGTITANNLNAVNNGGMGAVLDNCDRQLTGYCMTLVAKTVKLTGYNYFNNNDNKGLKILSFGAITVSNVTASYNGNATGEDGADLQNDFSNNNASIHVESVGTITLTGYGFFNNNGGTGSGNGLYVSSHDNISLTNLTANNNADNGVSLNANKIIPTVKTVSGVKVTISIASVAVTGLNNFVSNGADGLYVSADGSITLASVSANFNGGDGAELHTELQAPVGYGSSVTLTGTNTFTQNADTGLYVKSTGTISVSNITSTYNLKGAQLLNNNAINITKPYNVTLSGTNFFNFNDADGLTVLSYGIISVNNLTANGNGLVAAVTESGNGATLDSCNYAGDYIHTPVVCSTITAKTVTLTGYVNVSDNYFRGLQIYNQGAVTLSNIFANGNGNVGLHIVNRFTPTISYSVVRTITIKGTNTFNYNGSSGLFINTFGAISLNNVNAYGNLGPAGAYLQNDIAGGGTKYTAKTITVTGVNSFINNLAYGLYFKSDGAVTLTRINADGNDPTAGGPTGGGLVGTAYSITLTCGHMYGNGKFDGTTGYNLVATHALTIKGIYSAGNNNGTVPDIATGVPAIITSACALP